MVTHARAEPAVTGGWLTRLERRFARLHTEGQTVIVFVEVMVMAMVIVLSEVFVVVVVAPVKTEYSLNFVSILLLYRMIVLEGDRSKN